MAGLSARFTKAGYTVPKYMLEAYGKSLFDHAVESFKVYFESEKFIFIIRDISEATVFIEDRIKSLGIKEYEIVTLDEETRGQAETVALGLLKYKLSSESITIFNIDTFRPGFIYPDLSKLEDGYLEVFIGTGDNWSFVRPISNTSTEIDLTTEKNPISEYCCTGLYHFNKCSDYFDAFNAYLLKPISTWEKGELYIAPLYNYLINSERNIHYSLIHRDDVIFCGTPAEYDELLLNEGEGCV
jgi:hypothetical protein